MPKIQFLLAGTLDDSSIIKPKAHCWTQSAQEWMRFDEDDIKIETQPEDLSELLGS
jgi:hypothetical protein